MRHLLADYPKETSRYDELLTRDGEIREHWQPLFEHLHNASPEHMKRRLRYVQRQIFENGISYNVYADSKGTERPWELDVLPLMLARDEWQQIEQAVIQRATLCNRILADVYGDQVLLKEGRLPPALIHGHAGFQRPAHGIKLPDDVHLHIYAADLARSPDGRWWFIADRTQAPSGAGYALENRLVISKVFPDQFRDLKVQHLSGFFSTLRESLAYWAPTDKRAGAGPRVVLLTPGPYNETYFEHAYLARYLGYPLVEGHDLTVRHGCVWLKTLDGLQRVHVVLRRLDDDFCDPLELRADSALGIPGLVQAARNGKVLVANALGSSLLESGALMGFLPGLCQRLLGEELKIPSVATWWCGEPAALEDAISKLDHLVIKGAFPQLRLETRFGADLSERARELLSLQMRARPYNYVAQELVEVSQAPAWDKNHPRQLDARSVGLRVYAVATPNGYVAMQGGLARVAGAKEARVITMQRGGASKDVWVPAEGAVNTQSLLKGGITSQDIVRAGANLSSRMVENLFWFGRYAERCDDTARLLRIALSRCLDAGLADPSEPKAAIFSVCRSHGLLTPPPLGPEEAKVLESAARRKSRKQSVEELLLYATYGLDHPTGLASNLHFLFRTGSQLRERLSLDNWRTLNRLMQELEQRRISKPDLGEAIGSLDHAVTALMTLSGFSLDGMTRDEGWRFLSIGRRLERLQFIVSVLHEVLLDANMQRGNLEWMLEVADSIITYRSRYMARPEMLPLLDLLLLDDSNPRSVMFQVQGLFDQCQRLNEHLGSFTEQLEPFLHRLRRLDLDVELAVPEDGDLVPLLEELQNVSYALSEQISQRFFSHVLEQRLQAT